MEKTYAHALLSLLERPGADEKKLFDQLITHLKARGRLKLLPGIKRELEREQMRRATKTAHVEVAHRDETADALTEAAAAGIVAKHAQVNTTLVRGWRARQGSVLIDRSGKRALIDLYRRITA